MKMRSATLTQFVHSHSQKPFVNYEMENKKCNPHTVRAQLERKAAATARTATKKTLQNILKMKTQDRPSHTFCTSTSQNSSDSSSERAVACVFLYQSRVNRPASS